jgi:triosephosphate isomerase
VNPFRRPLVAGNWKMNKGGRDACDLAHDVAARTHGKTRVDVVVAPPFTALAAVAHQIDEVRGSIDVTENFGVGIAAQNLHAKSSGAFTGEVSAPFLRDSGVTWVIIGHSERRQLFGETDEGVAEKTKSALEGNLRPIVCVGETLAEREAGETLAVVERQVRAFVGVLASAPGTGVIAYEPVWAIGTGKVASPADAQEVHARIRELLMEVSEELAETTRILYGGSVKGDNAAGLFAEADLDGALVGGASLDAEGFGQIVDAAEAQAIALAEDDGDIDGDNDESLAEDDGGTDESLAEDAPEAPAAEATAQAEPSEPASDSDEEPLT